MCLCLVRTPPLGRLVLVLREAVDLVGVKPSTGIHLNSPPFIKENQFPILQITVIINLDDYQKLACLPALVQIVNGMLF